MQRKIFVTRAVPEVGITHLRNAGHEVDVSAKDGVLTREELIESLRQKAYDGVLCLLTDKIDGEVFDAVPSAKIFANYAVGFDNINLPDAKARNVAVTNTPGVLTDTVAEHTFALVSALAHRVVEADAFTRKGLYKGWAPMLFLGTDLKNKTLGIVGAGRIGERVAHHAKNGFDMKVHYYDIKRSDVLEHTYEATYHESLEDLLSIADFVSIHVPLLPATKHLINKERLARMKKTAFLVNTSRGPVVDEKALVEALRSGVIRGAALDVFEEEPKLAPGLSDLENVIITPHIASATEGAREAMAVMAAENLLAYFSGKIPPNLVT